MSFMHNTPRASICKAATETPPSEPVVECLGCHKDFVWWLHPVQLCDDCVALEYAKAEIENRGS
jgi:hypothetical protein